MDSSETDGEGNGRTTSDAGEQEGSRPVPGADGEQGRATGAGASVLKDDRVDGEEEIDQPVCTQCPGAPSDKERADHEITHDPYRKWSEWCVRGRALGKKAKSVSAEMW